jgi:8-oxo-dGTP diphosphatase
MRQAIETGADERLGSSSIRSENFLESRDVDQSHVAAHVRRQSLRTTCGKLLAPDNSSPWTPNRMPSSPLSPKVGVGVIVIRDSLVLLGKRRGSHGAGTWSAPGGALEFAEDIVDCAARELKEETGLTASSLELGPYTNDVFKEDGKHCVTVFVVARGIQGTPANLEPDKCEGWAWFRWGQWPVPLFQPLQSLLRIGWRPGGA